MANEEFLSRRRLVRWAWGTAIVVFAIIVAVLLWPRAHEVDLATVDRGDVSVDVVDQGLTRMHDVYVVSAPFAGRVLRVEVQPGDRVAAGSVVARMTRALAGFLDARSDLQAQAAVDSATAQLRSAQTQLDLAASDDARTRDLAA